MQGILTFAGLFAATVGAFLIESYKSLSPDTGAQTVVLLAQLVSITNSTNSTLSTDVAIPPFQASETAILVNTLWFAALVLSLLCALAATLVQDWTRRFLGQARPVGESLEQYSLMQLLVHLGVQRYGIDYVASLVVTMMHAAVVIFLVGLNFFLFPINTGPADAVFWICIISAASYLLASAIPLFDSRCPYRTPLTQIFTAFVIIPLSTLSCLLYYGFILISAALYRIENGPLEPIMRQFLGPRLLWEFMREPKRTSRVLHAAIRDNIRPKARRATTLLQRLLSAYAIRGESQGRPFMDEHAFRFLWDHVSVYVLARPREMTYIGLYLLNGEVHNYDSLFVGLRQLQGFMTKVATTLDSVDSVSTAKGAVRLLQAIFIAKTQNDEYSFAAIGEGWRWTAARPVLRRFRDFAGRLNQLNAQALREGDPSLLVAVSSLRSSLIMTLLRRLSEDTHPRSTTRDVLAFILRSLDGAENSLRLLPLSSNDGDGDERLFDDIEGRRLTLAARNAFTLLSGVGSCHWRGRWQNPDSPYVDHKEQPSIWSWRRMYAKAIRDRQRSPASEAFRDLLKAAGLRAWLEPGSTLSTLPTIATSDGGPPAAAVRALRDLTKMVDLPALPTQTGDYEESSRASVAAANLDQVPTTAALRIAEAGGSVMDANKVSTLNSLTPAKTELFNKSLIMVAIGVSGVNDEEETISREDIQADAQEM
ncbi:unnamed protein product [Peniophora sp. CBMAI 1063]|nr:unnamed protein product [Peniophora sp. CBMAI 1063]